MTPYFPALAIAGALFGACFTADVTFAQKSGGVLKVYFFDSPASMSIHEEATIAGQGPAMGVFNNLVMYNQDVPQSGLQSIVPDLASCRCYEGCSSGGVRSGCGLRHSQA